MNTNWPIKKLGEVLISLESGTRPKGGVRHILNGIPSVGAEHLEGNGSFDFTKLKFIPTEFYKKLTRGIIQNRDILVVKDGATTGKVSLVTENFPFKKAAVNEHVFILRFDTNQALSDYLFRFLFSNNGQEQILRTFHGAAQGGINSDFVNHVEIPLPPLPIQKKIVSEIEKLFTKIDKARRLRSEAIVESESILSSAMNQIFSQRNGKKWPVKKLGKIIELRYGKGISKYDRKQDGKYLIYGANGELGRSDKYLIEGEGIIIGRKGSAGELTRVSGRFWPSDVTYYVFGNRNITTDFLFYILKKVNLKQLATGIKPGINRNKVYELEIPLPSITEQKKIVKYLDSLAKKTKELIAYQKSQLVDLDALKKSILNKAFKGE